MDKHNELDINNGTEEIVSMEFALAVNAILDDVIKCSLDRDEKAPICTSEIGQHVAAILFIFQDDDGIGESEINISRKIAQNMVRAVIYCYNPETRTIDRHHLRQIYEQIRAENIPSDSEIRSARNVLILQMRYHFRRCLSTVLSPHTPKGEKLEVERYLRSALSALPDDTFTDRLFAKLYLSAHRSDTEFPIPGKFALSRPEALAFSAQLSAAFKESPEN